jgi:Leucine-rich repeat (LRR) protein
MGIVKTVNKKFTLDLSYQEEEYDFGIPESGIWCKDLNEIIEYIQPVKDTVKKINFYNQHTLTVVPEILTQCPNLEELDFSFTNIKEIPAFVFSLPKLRSLKCKCNDLEKQPEGFSAAVHLENLSLNIPKGQGIPQEIWSLKNLKTLSISGHAGITEFPAEFAQLENLEELEINYCKMSRIPEEVARFKKLKKLSLHYSPFSNDVFGLSPKERFALDLPAVVKSLAACPAFNELYVRGFDIGEGYISLPLLKNLKKIEFWHLYTKPSADGNLLDSLCRIATLESLVIYGTDFGIKELPPAIGNLSNLKTLSIVGNPFRNIPPSFYSLENLETIEFMGCCVKELSEDISRLKKLRQLMLSDNMLEKIPASLLQIQTLRKLELGGNNLGKEYLSQFKGIKKPKVTKSNQGYTWNYKLLQDSKEKNYTQEEYVALCMKAVEDFPGGALHEMDKSRCTQADYYAVCVSAAKKSGLAIQYINADDFTEAQYFEICCEAVKQNPETLKYYVDIDRFAPARYKELCLAAVRNNRMWAFLKGIKPEKLSREDYVEVCHESIKQHPLTIVNMKDPPLEFWREAVGYAVKQYGSNNVVLRDMPPDIQMQLYGKVLPDAEQLP